MKKHVKFILFTTILLIIILLILYQKTRPIEVSASNVTRGSLVDSFREEGLIESNSNHSIYVPYDGKIRQILEEGSAVKKGDPLLIMDDAMLILQKDQLISQIQSIRGQQNISLSAVTDNQLEMATIAIETAKTNLEDARKNYDRIKSLYELGGSSKIELENAQNLYNNAKNDLSIKEKQLKELQDKRIEKPGSKQFYGGQIDALEAQLQDIEEKLKRTTIFAPVDGMVKYSLGKSGGYAQAIQPVIEIASTNDLIVSSKVLTKNIPALKIGQQIRIIQKTYAGDIEYSAEITHIDDFAHQNISSLGLDEQRVEVKAKMLQSGSLKDGYGVDVVFDAFRKDNVLVIDKTSYFEDDNKSYVWKISENHLEKTEISLGYIGAYEAEVLEGLVENDQIVTDPNNSNFSNGARIKIK